MSISKGKMRLDRPISQIHNWGLHPRYLSNSLCTDAPPPLRKYQGERRLWIVVVNRVPVNTYVNYSVCFPSDSWKGVDRPTPLLLFLFSPVPLVFPVLFVPLFLLFSWSPHSLFPLIPLLPCYPVPPIPLVTLFLLLPLFLLFPSFPCFLFPLFLFFPCSLVSPVSLVLLVPLFPLLPLFSCSPCSPVCVFWLSLWFYFELCAKNKLSFLRFLFYCSLQISFVTVLAYCNKQLSLEESLLALTNVSLEQIYVQ